MKMAEGAWNHSAVSYWQGGGGAQANPNYELVVTSDMHERKHQLFENADAFVALPGGIGTVEEIVEVMTWAQLGRHRKPMVFANILGFWDPMLAMLAHMQEEGFIHTGHLVKPLVIADVEDIIPAMLAAAKADAEGTKRKSSVSCEQPFSLPRPVSGLVIEFQGTYRACGPADWN